MHGNQTTRTAIVLSGGGARGAYEAGVLAYLLEELPLKLGRRVRFELITGTSVGAVHAVYLAAHQDDADVARRLRQVWLSLSLDRVFTPRRLGDLVRAPLRLLGLGEQPPPLPPTRGGVPERLPGLFDTGWLEDIILTNIDWARLRERIDSGALDALALAATEIATGRSVVFIDRGGRPLVPWSYDPFVVARATQIGPAHALASAAIPLFFPALRIDRTYYCDGGLRLNTPLAPAVRLGADRILVVSLRHSRPPAEEDRLARKREAAYNSLSYLAGKALNALLIDRVEQDLQRLRALNAIFEKGTALYGSDFLQRLNAALGADRSSPYRIVRDFLIHPSRDLGEVAAECMRHRSRASSMREWLSRNLAWAVSRGTIGEADLLSYVYFDSCYAAHLIELGWKDAAAAEQELVRFFGAETS
ncbi:MAG: patatin-like phospholipase family protein [Candidatus Binatia bacterium]|nr:patatin-like phospholipase family protein [Candidatus Binatia bacterium]